MISLLIIIALLINYVFRARFTFITKHYSSDKRSARALQQALLYAIPLSLSVSIAYIFYLTPIGIFAFIVVFAVASAFIASSVFAAAFIMSDSVGLILLIVILASSLVLFFRRYFELLTGRPTLVLLVLIVIANVTAFGSLIHSGNASSGSSHYILLLFVLFPTVNTFADFLSIGFTRACLRQGIRNNMAKWACLDAMFGISLIFTLSIATVAAIALVDNLSGVKLVDLELLLGDPTTEGSILNSPSSYTWLYASIATPVIPTAIHVCIALLGMVTIAPAPLRQWIVACLEAGLRGSDNAMRLGVLTICATVGASVTILVVATVYIVKGLWLLLPELGPLIVSALRTISNAI